jgi:hypothetical protein
MRPSIGIVASALALLALAAGLGACGGSGEETLPRGTLTKKQFLKKANAICVAGLEEMNEADLAAWKRYEPDHSTTDEAILNKVSLALIPAREKDLRRLHAVGLPKGDERLVDEILTAWEEGVDEVKEEPSLMREAPADSGFNRAYRMGEKYGFLC